ncbi:hypothetical protein EON83_12330 [bacterium]|nr:MAG: hypothetical protein EON83_12330 [bacterium]
MNWFQLLEHAATGGALLVQLALKATLLLLVGFAIVALLQRSSAAVRHVLWATCCLCLLLLPAFSIALPAWHPVIWQPKVTVPPSPSSDTLSAANIPAPINFAEQAPTFLLPTVAAPSSDSGPVIPLTQWVLASLFVCWLLGGMVVTRKMGTGFVAAKRLSRRGRPITEGPLWDELIQCSESLNMNARPRLLLVADEALPIPLTWGCWPPVVLMPESSQQWVPSCRSAALLHELSHIRRLDWLIQSLASLTCLFYWFHPLAWVALHRLRLESERATDDMVLQTGLKATDYSSSLLEIVHLVGSQRTNTTPKDSLMKFAVPMSGTSKIELRLRSILDPKQSRSVVTQKLFVGIALASFATVVPLATAKEPAETNTPVEPQQPSARAPLTDPTSAIKPSAAKPVQPSPAIVSATKKGAPSVFAAPAGSAAKTTNTPSVFTAPVAAKAANKTNAPSVFAIPPIESANAAKPGTTQSQPALSRKKPSLYNPSIPPASAAASTRQPSIYADNGYASAISPTQPTIPRQPSETRASAFATTSPQGTATLFPPNTASSNRSATESVYPQNASYAGTDQPASPPIYVREAYAGGTNSLSFRAEGTSHPRKDTLVTGFKFSGNTLLKDEDLQKVLVSKLGVVLNMKSVSEDRNALQRAYAAKGSILQIPRVALDDAGIMTYHLIENPAVTGYRFHGNKALSADELAKVMVSKPGVRYDWKSVEEDKKAVKKAYAAKGLEVSINNVMQDDDGAISYNVDEGKITQVNIVGLTKTDPEVARKLIMAKVNEPADPLTFYLDTVRIGKSDLFKSYGIKTKEDPDVRGGVIVTYLFTEKEDTL